MLTGLARLGLEVKDLATVRRFYEDRLGLVPDATDETRVRYPVGEPSNDRAGDAPDDGDDERTALVLRRPTDRPRGGVHTHYAFATSRSAYPRWRRRLADLDPVEFSFGSSDSLYVYDPAGHCVEIGGVHGDGPADAPEPTDGTADPDAAAGSETPPLSGVFEVVFEVTDLGRAESRYRRLGFEVVDRGEKRRRVRLSGPVDLELWEPQLGIADARGGLHVDLALRAIDPDAAVEAGGPWAAGPVAAEGGLRVVDDDGHVLTFLPDGL